MKVHHHDHRKGFTLAELLAVLGIIAILLAVTVPSLLLHQRDLKLTELDDNARAVFMAAQNHLTALRSASAGEEMDVSVAAGRGALAVPADAVDGLESGTELMYVSTNVSGADPDWLVLPGSIEGDLSSEDSCYLVEFDPASGAVYGVFFTERSGGRELDESVYEQIYSYASSDGASCRIREGRSAFARSSGGFPVGYYGADGALDVIRPDSLKLPAPKLKLINAEELVLEITTDPSSWPASIDQSKLFATVSVTDASGAAGKTLVKKGAIRSGTTARVVLDTLKTSLYDRGDTQTTSGWKVGGSFAQWMALPGGGYTITPGEDVNVTVSIWYQSGGGEGLVALPQTAGVSTNSLFAARSGGKVEIAYGRHLQNLDAEGLDSAVTSAVQTREIDFAQAKPAGGNDLYYWSETYNHAGRPFVPVSNDKLDSYNGMSLAIRNLNAQEDDAGNAGLFGAFSGSELKDVVLVDAKVTGTVAGALAGTAEHTTVDGCRVYLTGPTAATRAVTATARAGGLFGAATDCVIQNGTFASTVVRGGLVGGMIGNATRTSIDGSYAAGHLSGATVGGLVGGGSRITVTNSYTAGTIFSASAEAGGLCPGPITARNVYAAVDYVNVPAPNADGSANVYGAVPSGSVCTNVCYLSKPGVNDGGMGTSVSGTDDMKLATALAGLKTPAGEEPIFTEGGDAEVPAYPYGLPNLPDNTREPALTAPYPYPTLAGLDHYGDWLMSQPVPKSLIAYYEQFHDGSVDHYSTEFSYILNGEEKGTLDLTRTKAINADGYAFLSEKKLHNSWETAATLNVTTVGMETKTIAVQGTFLGPLDEDLNRAANGTTPAYYAYAIPTYALDVIPNGVYCVDVTIQATSSIIEYGKKPDEVELTAWVNPLFGRSAYNGSKPSGNPSTIHVRSLRQLANMGRFFGVHNYVQDLDVDGQVYIGDLAGNLDGPILYQKGVGVNDAGHVTMAGLEMWGYNNSTRAWGYVTDKENLPEEYHLIISPIGAHESPDGATGGYNIVNPFNGTYDGKGREIRSLSIRPYYHADDKAYYAGLFYRLISGKLMNINLKNSDVIGAIGTASNATGALVGRLSSSGQMLNCTVDNCTVTVAPEPGAKKAKAGGQVGGVIGYADSSIVAQGCAITNSTVDGGAYAHNAGGFVGYTYRMKDDGAIRDCTVKDVAVSGGFLGKDSVTNIGKVGTAGGFLGCAQENAGTVENCKVIGTGELNVSGSTRANGGFAGILNSEGSGRVLGCAVRLEGKPGEKYEFQGVSGGRFTGGFAGEITGGSVSASYASVKVDGTNAGGFAGTLTGGSVSNSYAGGRTKNAKYTKDLPNVTGTEKAGGFVGSWTGGSLDACYTTCAVSGPTNDATDVFANLETATLNSPVNDCYALGTAFVGGTKKGSLTQTKAAVTGTILPADARTETHAYDTVLTGGYPYTPVKDAAGNALPHYGDWPDKASGGSGRKWVQQVQTYTPIEENYENLTVDQPEWNGDMLTITYHVSSLADENDLTNTGPKLPDGTPYYNGVFSLTSDLGYRQIFRVVKEDGYKILGLPGATFTRTEVGTPGVEGHGFTWVINIPSELIPPYVDHVSLDAMEHVEGVGDKCIIENIVNADPNYSGENKVDRLGDDEGITIGEGAANTTECFKDWLGYQHQLMEIMAPLANTPLDGHMEGAALGLDNKVFFHMTNTNKSTIQPWTTQINGSSISGISEVVLEGPNDVKVTIPGYNLLNGSQPYPSTKPGLVQYQLGGYFPPSWQMVECASIAFYASEDREEFEMEIDLDKVAQAMGYENGDVFTQTTLKFYSATMRDLQVKRDPPET